MGEETGIPQIPTTQSLNHDNPKLVYSPSEAQSMATSLGLTNLDDLLPILVQSGRRLAQVPISSFTVCAGALTKEGGIYLGVNLEFKGLPLHHSVHAEQCLVTNLSLHHETHLRKIVVSAYPCGHCRQFLQEIRGAPEIQILVPGSDLGSESQSHGHPLSHLLANRFGPDDLLPNDVPLILERHENGLVLLEKEKEEIVEDAENGHWYAKIDVKGLAEKALEAANESHAPYSGCPSGIVLVDLDGKVYKGSYMESAAYNPSLGPGQAAIVAFLAGMGGGYERIVGVVLVEKEGAIVKQEETAKLFFETVVPKCEFHVYHCKSK